MLEDQESTGPSLTQCHKQCICEYVETFAADVNCHSGTNAAEVIDFTASKPVLGWHAESDCFEACKSHLACHGYVWEKKGESGTEHNCWGVKNPTSEIAGFPNLRPLSGVQLGACDLPHPEKTLYDQNVISQGCDAAASPYLWGQKTKFLSCRPAPWSRCSLFGDPHVSTFDRPYSDAKCPTTPGQRNSGKFTVKSDGNFRLVELPQGSGTEVLVLGKSGYTSKHTSVASMKGLAVQGSFLGSNSVVIEMNTAGNLLLKWNGVTMFTVAAETQDSDAVDRGPVSNQDGTATCWLKWENNALNQLPFGGGVTKKKPLIACKLFERANPDEEFLRIFVERMNKEYRNMSTSFYP